jgi:DNA invertase Pin-like site-specific DNA recombinase
MAKISRRRVMPAVYRGRHWRATWSLGTLGETDRRIHLTLPKCPAMLMGAHRPSLSPDAGFALSRVPRRERADNRPGLQKAIAAACERKAVLCVYSLSRLARCTKDAIDLAERLSAAGADLAVIAENVNTRSPMGRFIFTLFSALAQLEREQIAERTSTAMLRHQAKGRRMTRPDRCPYGWRPHPAEPDRLMEDADEQRVILRIREERRHGRGLREIARRLDLAGIACRGGRWSHSTIRSVLRRTANCTSGT